LTERLKVLLVEDSPMDAELVLLELARGGFQVEADRVDTARTMAAVLAQGGWDIVLSDYQMPRFSGLDALRLLQATDPDIPFILVSGAVGEEEAVAALKAGAHGYVLKHNLQHLCLEVEHELKAAAARRERRQAKEELARSEERYRGLFEHSPMPLAVQDFSEVKRLILGYREAGVEDLRGFFEEHPGEVRRCARAVRIKEGNAACARFFERFDTVGTAWNFSELYSDASWTVFQEELLTLAQGSLHWQAEMPFQFPGGVTKTISVHLSVSPGSEASLKRVLISFLDVTERVQMEAKLRDLDRLSAKGQMAAYIAHEINNPLAGIKNAFALLEPAIPLEHPHRRYADLIKREIDRIAGIIRTMYHVYRPSGAEPGEAGLQEVFEDIQNLLVPMCRNAGVAIVLELQEPGMKVHFSGGLLRQVIFNLAQNAVEASSRGGNVVLAARHTSRGSEITVRDQGSGIPDTWNERIFQQGFSSKRDSGMSGLGLGLYTCKSIVESMGGALDFTSAGPGGGCTFRVRLPGLPPADPPPEPLP